MGTLLIITEQYMEPTIANSIVPLRELNVAHILERMLKLSIPTLYGWVIIFYALFPRVAQHSGGDHLLWRQGILQGQQVYYKIVKAGSLGCCRVLT